MKKGILFLLLLSSVFVKAQSLKDALFSGKLKNNAGVIRKGDDLSSKMDTAQKVATEETVKTTATPAGADSSANTTPLKTDSTAIATTDSPSTSDSATTVAPATVAAPKNNTSIWKAYADSVATTLKAKVLSSKKIKRGDYAVLVSYTIETDGQTTVSDVFLSPENAYLQQQIKERLGADSPRLAPVLNSVGAPRKVSKKYSFTLSKE